jgi:hypothetical protein
MATQPIPEFDSQVKLNATVGNAPYAQSFDNMALTPDTLGQIGSTLATNASMELAKRRGIQAGLNPSGEVLPPLTGADKAYIDAYQNQAHATLSNQGQKVINEADEALSKLNKIGQGDIAQYQQTVQKSLDDILQLAPNDTKVSLFNSFNQELTSSIHNYQTRLIGQQKAEQRANSDLAISTANQNVHNAWLDGNVEKAARFLTEQTNQISKAVSAGIYSKSKGDALKKSAGLNYLSSEQIQNGIKAHNEGKGAQWLESLVEPSKKPKNISWSDWETVGNNARKYLANRKLFTKQASQTIASQGYLDIANQVMTSEKLAQYQEDLKEEPRLFNNLAIAFAHMNHSGSSKAAAQAELSANWQNNDYMKTASNDAINKSFMQLSNLYQERQQANGNPISQSEAQFVTASSAAVPVPLYIQSLQRQVSSGIHGQMTEGIHYYNRLKELPGNKAAGFLNDQKSVAMKENFQNALDEGNTEEEAAAIAQEIWNQKDKPDVVNFIQAQTDSALKTFANTTPDSYQWARNTLDIPSDATIESPGGMAAQFRSLFSTNMKVTNGNVEVSKKAAKEGMQQTFGETSINGIKGYMQYPPEKMIGLGKAAVPLMQEDLYQQIKPAIEFSKKAYESGAQPFYYEIAERPDYKAYREAKARLDKGLSDPTYAIDKQAINKFYSGAPIVIHKIYQTGKKEEWTTYLKSNPNQSLDIKTGELIGGYDIGLFDKKSGAQDSLFGVFPNGRTHLSWKPNTQWIRENYLSVAGIVPKDPNITKAQAAEYIKNYDEIEYKKSFSYQLNQMGRGFS